MVLNMKGIEECDEKLVIFCYFVWSGLKGGWVGKYLIRVSMFVLLECWVVI